jgi:hypothetical protein
MGRGEDFGCMKSINGETKRHGGLVGRGRCPGAASGRPRLARLASWLGAGRGRNARGAPGGASASRLMRARAARPGVGLLAWGEDLGASGKGRSRGLGGSAAECARGRLLARRSDRERGKGERIGGEGARSRERWRQGEPVGSAARVWVARPLVGLMLGVFFFYSKCNF